MEVELALGNHIGAAYINREPIMDLKVATIVSFCWPQLVPQSSLRMFSLGFALLTMS